MNGYETVQAAAGLIGLFAEPTRVRLAALLERHELSVAEITEVTGLAQSRVSTHLGKLREAGVLRDRKAGPATFYALSGDMPARARQVWDAVSAGLDDDVVDGDRRRSETVVRARAAQRGWPDDVAGQMERHYSPGRTWESLARGLVALARLGDVLDAGAGDGSVAQMLAPRARSYACLDASPAMVNAARRRLAGLPGVTVREGDAQALPFAARSFDQVLLFHVLTHVETPARALGEVARVLRPGGRVAVVTLDAHRHHDVTRAYRDRHPGFSPRSLRALLARAGLAVLECAVTSREKRAPHFQVVTALAEVSP